MNLVDALLTADTSKLTTKETTKLEIPRLTKALGIPFIMTLQAIAPRRMDEINEIAIKMTRNGRYQGVDLTKMHELVLCEGIIDPPLNGEVQKKFKAATPADLVNKLFNAGEINKIFNAIQKLSGNVDEEEEAAQKDEVKN